MANHPPNLLLDIAEDSVSSKEKVVSNHQGGRTPKADADIKDSFPNGSFGPIKRD